MQVTDNATLILRLPIHFSRKKIPKLIEKNKKWIEKNINIMRNRQQKFIKKRFVEGELFLYLGKTYPLHITNNSSHPLLFQNGFFLSAQYLSSASVVFESWYRKEASQIIPERVKLLSEIYGIPYEAVKISSAQKRWGSCSAGNTLRFSWRLLLAPMSVIDYVIVHELAHTSEKNHSRNFWKKVEIMMANYKEERKWLNANGYLLKI